MTIIDINYPTFNLQLKIIFRLLICLELNLFARP